MFPEHQISILEWFLKDNMTLNSGIMMPMIQLCVTGINQILKQIQIENRTVITILIIYSLYCIFDQINAAYHRIAHLKLLFENMGVSHTQKNPLSSSSTHPWLWAEVAVVTHYWKPLLLLAVKRAAILWKEAERLKRGSARLRALWCRGEGRRGSLLVWLSLDFL